MTTTETPQRMNLGELAPRVMKAMLALDAVAGDGLEAPLKELVQLRASQVNGCSFCIDLHSRDARTGGETERRLFALPGWHDAPFYTERERAALALTEAATRLDAGGVPDDVYAAAAAEFGPAELAQLIGLIMTINAWNRIGVTTRLQPAGA